MFGLGPTVMSTPQNRQDRRGFQASRVVTSVEVSRDVSAFIAARIERYAEEAPENVQWLLPFVEEDRGLPLYNGWTESIAIRATGEVVVWETEDWGRSAESDYAMFARHALVEGAKKYPELTVLIPTRPATARTCEHCGGTGYVDGLPHAMRDMVICRCAGLGWLPDAEA